VSSAPHLLHVLPGFAPGGTELRLVKLINAIGPSFRHSILSLDGGFEAASRLTESVALVPPPPRRGPLRFPLALRRLARRIDPDVILTYNWGATDMILGARWFSPACFVHNECGFGPDEAVRLKPRRVWARRFLLNRVFTTIVVSETLREIAQSRFRIRPPRLTYIPTGVDSRRFHPAPVDSVRRRLGLPDGLLIGYMGGLRPEKSVDLLIRAFARADLADASLVLVGDGPLRPRLEQLAAGLGLAGRVVFAGRAADPLPYYQSFDVFALSSATEQTPNALLEAMACALPCVATDVGDCAALLGRPGPPFLVPPADPAAFARSLHCLAADAGLRLRAGAANRLRAASVYSHEEMVRTYRAVWIDAANHARRDLRFSAENRV